MLKKKRGNFVVLKQQNMPTFPDNISKAGIEKLSYERYAYPHPMIQKRIFALYLKATSTFSNRQIGLIAGLHPNTVALFITGVVFFIAGISFRVPKIESSVAASH